MSSTLAASGPDLGGVVDDLEAVAQPLDRGPGGEDRPLEGVGDGAVGERPRHRRQHALRRRRQLGADVEQHEAARAVGVLGHAGMEAGLAEQRRLLVAGDAADGEAGRSAAAVRGHPDPPARRTDVGQVVDGHVEELAQLVVPRQPLDVEQQRAAGVGRVGGEDLPAGQVPDQPRVDRAEGEVGGARDTASPQQPLELGAAEVRVEHEPGAPAHEIEGALGRQLVAAGGGPAVLPDDRPAVRHAGGAVPRHDRLALVGDPDGDDRRVPTWSTTSPNVARPASQISTASCSTHPGRGKCWVNSRYDETPARRPSSGTVRLRIPVVPASMAMT